MLKQSPTIILALAPRRFYLLGLMMCLFLFFLLVPNRVSTQAPESCVQPQSGIIAWWPMDEEAGTTVADAAGSNSGTFIGALTHEAGKSGRALRFDGTRSFVGVRDSDLWAFGASDFTIELWANFATPGGGSIGQPSHVFIANDESPGTANKWFFALGGGFLNFHINGPGIGEQFFPLVPFSPEVGRWYHLAVSRQGNVYTIFIDGEPAGSAENTIAIPNANALLTIGEAEGLFFMNGLLDEVAIYNRALADAELRAIFLAGSAGKCKPPRITTRVLTSAQLGKPYEQALRAEFGTPPYTWSVASGSLPSGITLSVSGVLSGIPQETGSFNFVASLVDADGETNAASLSFDVLLITPPPEIRINKVGNIPVPGRTIDYFIVVENSGGATATDTQISELLDPLEQFTDPSLTNPAVSQIIGNLLIWNIETLQPGEFRVLNYKVTISPSVALGEFVRGDATIVCDACKDVDACKFLKTPCEAFDPPSLPTGVGLIDIFQLWFDEHFPSKECSAFTLQCQMECKKRCPNASSDKNAEAPSDPNEKLVVAQRFIRPDQTLVYPIHFENIGTIEARDIFVSDVLDPNLDATTLNLLTPTGGSFDVATRTVRWDLLNTNLQPGKTGNVMLAIRPRPGLPSGTVIRNSSTIQFEIFEPIVTNEVVNIIDSTRPTSVVDLLPAETSTVEFPISWGGTDAVGEIDFFSILVSVDGSSFTPFLEGTRETSATFRGEVGRTYGFIAIATDTAGNIEIQDATAEASTRVIPADCATGDTESPTITAPPAVTLYTGPGATSCGVTVNDLDTALGIASASDNCPSVTVARSGVPVGNVFSVGQTTITYTATDATGNSVTATQTVTVIDNTPPNITSESANPALLWPPNHTMRDVNVNYTAVDNCSSNCTLTVTSNEPENGTGDGDTAPDWEVIDPYHVRLRAERAAIGNGRMYTITVTCTDGAGNSTSKDVAVFVTHNIAGPASGAAFKIGTTVNFSGTFWDLPGRKHTAQWVFDDALATTGKVVEPSGSKSGTVTGTYTFTTPGVYKIRLKVTDNTGQTSWVDTAGDVEAIVVIYDPNGGYTIGGGYISTYPGSYPANLNKVGKLSFGFNSKYTNATNPKGETQVQFAMGGFEFNALNYDYLTISGARAQFRGFGKLNGESGYNFILTVIDGQLTGGGGVDKFRIKIWNKTTGAIVFDSQMGESDAVDPSIPVGKGSSIVIQR